MLLTVIIIAAALGWAYLLFGHGQFWHLILPQLPRRLLEDLPDIAIIVPARNEATMLPLTLPTLFAQDYPGRWRVILVDDHSADGTSAIAENIAAECDSLDRLQIIAAPDLPAGWSGKVHAMQAGLNAADDAEYVLFTDADIMHSSTSLSYLAARSLESHLDLHSLMVKLHCESAWEKLLIPAFVYFFQMLYPFAWSNDPANRVAAAAGGTMLVRMEALRQIGGLGAIKSEIIDDCALARAIKHRKNPDRPPRLLLTLVDHDIVSARPYDGLRGIWSMISRAAYTQLDHSPWLLIGAVAGMLVLFVSPILLCLAGGAAAFAGWLLFVAMIYSYLPMVEFYRLNILWAATLPVAALIYIGATIDSARLYGLGRGGAWKGRHQIGAKP
ncbi:MAG: glycosyltransferase [Alphaproteobacteria bacterium]